MLHLYILVATRNQDLTPLRMKAVTIVVEAPPDEWGWGQPDISVSQDTVQVGNPVEKGETKKYWLFNPSDSKAIWLSSGSYRSL